MKLSDSSPFWWGVLALSVAGAVWLLGFGRITTTVVAVSRVAPAHPVGPGRSSGGGGAATSLKPADRRAGVDYLRAVQHRIMQEDAEQLRTAAMQASIDGDGLDEDQVAERLKAHEEDQETSDQVHSAEDEAEAELTAHDAGLGELADKLRGYTARLTELHTKLREANAAVEQARVDGSNAGPLIKRQTDALASYKAALALKLEDL